MSGKGIISILLTVLLLSVTSCHKAIWDKLNDHEARITRLETFCNQMNTNLNSLQAIVDVLNARDYVKDVTPLSENGVVVGYTISFYNSNAVVIYNGKNGEDAPAPKIGIKKDDDNAWYWTLNGEWILDDDGNKVHADGVTPQLKIEEDYWWVSYDKGKSWTKLGAASGPQGSVDSLIQGIRQDGRYVYLILSDGEEIAITKGGLTWEYV